MDVPLQSRVEEEESLQLDAQRFKEQVEEEVKAIQLYNATINEHLPEYTTLVPLHDVLLRVYLREPKTITYGDTSLQVPDVSSQDMVEAKRRAASGDRYTQNLSETPFKWQTKAVVVATPPNDKVQVGDVVIIPYLDSQAFVKADESRYMTYTGAFVHPNYGSLEPPTSCMDNHFGYALLGLGYLKAKI